MDRDVGRCPYKAFRSHCCTSIIYRFALERGYLLPVSVLGAIHAFCNGGGGRNSFCPILPREFVSQVIQSMSTVINEILLLCSCNLIPWLFTFYTFIDDFDPIHIVVSPNYCCRCSSVPAQDLDSGQLLIMPADCLGSRLELNRN